MKITKCLIFITFFSCSYALAQDKQERNVLKKVTEECVAKVISETKKPPTREGVYKCLVLRKPKKKVNF